ncbi:selenocysteine-specific translation elongation factor [Noviherbaspirillum sp.]|uniref:selenocysteine-specific translation elongation factor n=1 Tax=Noviherbaspirillum sp. TaxID=1926288 RepID=UPI002B465B97|nr:selenocysteine-specific translation elongation factor [Noviherbaspirillum sp.]HJV79562.1 selenocysteine-specific translation elongation factor [Noviherbaspirillum sp.]
MIVATAGHVDHGKTTLVGALTGVDTDRLKEEKERGMSIDLGFAYADFGHGQRIGFVDVPGHERFLRNMLAGVAAIDFALLVVAADDGPMPQTVEHLAILQLLGMQCGAIALTKIDRVSAERVHAAQAEVRSLLAGSGLEAAPIFPMATTSGEGVQALREHLRDSARALAAKPARGHFRLVVDRSFILSGAGLVVAGPVLAGSVKVGDQLIVSPQGIPVRVRGIHAQNLPADAARAGERCALNIAGSELRHEMVGRGNWLVASALHAPSDRIDVCVKVLASEARALAHWRPVHVHIGAAVANARVAVLGERAIAPGQSGFAQLVLDAPVAALHGDRFVLRDQSAQRTIAGGEVVDPFGPSRGRAKSARLTQLAAMRIPQAAHALNALLDAQPEGVDLERFALARNLVADEVEALWTALGIHVVNARHGRLGFSPARWRSLQAQVLAALEDWHGRQPESLGPSEAQLEAAVGVPARSLLLSAVLAELIGQHKLRRAGLCVSLAQHVARLSEGDAALLAKVSTLLEANGLRPPIVGELARMLEMEQAVLLAFLERAAALGHLLRVAKNRFFLPATMETLAEAARQLAGASEQGSFDAAGYRDRTGIGRNLTIEVLEFLDRIRVTRFAGGRRRLA